MGESEREYYINSKKVTGEQVVSCVTQGTQHSNKTMKNTNSITV